LEPRRDTRSERLSSKGPADGRAATGRALVIEPALRRAVARTDALERTAEAKLDEAIGLARAIDLSVEQSGIVLLRALHPATYLSKGKVEEIAGLVKSFEAGVVVMDCALTPVQQRNLEKAWNAKVLDRTSLILEIFGRRARTREGALQVEHAHLTYQKGRLVRTWTHLERQRGLPRSKASSSRSSARARCIVRAAAACLIRSSPWSAIPMPANRRCSTA
jgi:GTP-binding protein HflX